MIKIKTVGIITEEIERLLGITITGDRSIYFGTSNLSHMKKSHPADFAKYGADLKTILAAIPATETGSLVCAALMTVICPMRDVARIMCAATIPVTAASTT